ncbi:hypothetical protein CHU98_g8440 [Xylaria longipes]|nr:hypothetical protein CHU98_g8440 [Xylaria longipes]
MMFPYLFLPFAIARAAAVPQGGSPTDELSFQSGIPSNHSIGDIEWRGFEDFDEGQAFTGTIEVTLALLLLSILKWQSNNATQNVIHQMRQIKGTHYMPSFVSRAENHTLEAEPNYHIASRKVTCGGPPADLMGTFEGIRYLSHISNSIMCNTPPASCGRISCSYNSAIYWCNENSYLTGARCNMFAQYAIQVFIACTNKNKVSGKILDTNTKLSVKVIGVNRELLFMMPVGCQMPHHDLGQDAFDAVPSGNCPGLQTTN